jgi:hypothetical protein
MSILLSWQWRTSIVSTLLTTLSCHLLSTILKYPTSFWLFFIVSHWIIDSDSDALTTPTQQLDPNFISFPTFPAPKLKPISHNNCNFLFSCIHPSSTSHRYCRAIEPYRSFVFPSSQVASYVKVPVGIDCVFFLPRRHPIMTPVTTRRTWPWTDWRRLFVSDCSPDVAILTVSCLPIKTIWPQGHQPATMAMDFLTLARCWIQKIITVPATTLDFERIKLDRPFDFLSSQVLPPTLRFP